MKERRKLECKETFYLHKHTPRTSRFRHDRISWHGGGWQVLARYLGPVTGFKF